MAVEDWYLLTFGRRKYKHKRYITENDYRNNKDYYDSLSKDYELIVSGHSLDKHPEIESMLNPN